VEFTRSSFDASRVSSCLADIKNLRWERLNRHYCIAVLDQLF
jgi:hypothetical protein